MESSTTIPTNSIATADLASSGPSRPLFYRKGSRRWLQVALHHAPDLINAPVRAALGRPIDHPIDWLSPRADERFIEYRDGAFVKLLGVPLPHMSLQEFWPSGGPVWDGLAKTAAGDLLLVEAKAHIPEMISSASRASTESWNRITASLERVRKEIAPRTTGDWTGPFYQYFNRLAHLHFLREWNGAPAHLVFVYFYNAPDVAGPRSPAEWHGAITLLESYLGLRRHRLSKYIHHVMIDVNPLVTHVVSSEADAEHA